MKKMLIVGLILSTTIGLNALETIKASEIALTEFPSYKSLSFSTSIKGVLYWQKMYPNCEIYFMNGSRQEYHVFHEKSEACGVKK